MYIDCTGTWRTESSWVKVNHGHHTGHGCATQWRHHYNTYCCVDDVWHWRMRLCDVRRSVRLSVETTASTQHLQSLEVISSTDITSDAAAHWWHRQAATICTHTHIPSALLAPILLTTDDGLPRVWPMSRPGWEPVNLDLTRPKPGYVAGFKSTGRQAWNHPCARSLVMSVSQGYSPWPLSLSFPVTAPIDSRKDHMCRGSVELT